MSYVKNVFRFLMTMLKAVVLLGVIGAVVYCISCFPAVRAHEALTQGQGKEDLLSSASKLLESKTNSPAYRVVCKEERLGLFSESGWLIEGEEQELFVRKFQLNAQKIAKPGQPVNFHCVVERQAATTILDPGEILSRIVPSKEN